MRRFMQSSPLGLRFGLAGSLTLLASLLGLPQSAQAQVSLPSAGGRIEFQTSGPARCANIGDWYTTFGDSNQTAGQAIVNAVGPGALCGPTDPAPVGNAAPPGRFLVHRFSINIPADLAATGTTVTVLDAGTGGIRDEVDGLNGANFDPTRFALIAPDGTVLGTQVFNGPGNAVFTIPPGSTPGSYVVTSETGEARINPSAPFNPLLNNDDNSFSIQVSGATELLIGQFQSTFQNINSLNIPLDFYFLAGPQTGAIDILNFDMDNDGQLTYIDPNNVNTNGTVSANRQWNSGTLARPASLGAPDSFNVSVTNAGRWQINLANYGLAFNNQSALEVNERARQEPLPIFDRPPTTAGNFTIVDTGQRVNGRCLFTITNNFFTNDIINLQGDVLAADGVTALPNSDAAIGDTLPDTDVLRPRQSRQITITGTVNAFSFMEQRVRGTATARAINCGAPTTPPTGVAPNLILVKRITNVVRNGAVLPGVTFGNFVDDPNSTTDNDPGWSQIPLVGIIALPIENPVRSGDEVTYTVYFLSNGGAPVLDTNLCDQIPGGTTFVPGSLELRLANNPVTAVGEFFTPLAPLPANNSCTVQTNPNGATVTELGTIPNDAGSNFGLIRFRVRVN